MNWKQHLAIGVILFALLTFVVVILDRYLHVFTMTIDAELLVAFPVILYTSLLPDMDIKTSKVFGFTWLVAIIVVIFLMFVEMIPSAILFLCVMACTLFLRHRGWLHHPGVSIIVGIVAGFVFSSYVVGIFAAVGYASHTVIEYEPKKKKVRG